MTQHRRVSPFLMVAAMTALACGGVGCGHRQDRQIVDQPEHQGATQAPPLVVKSPVTTISVEEPSADAQTFSVPVVIELDDIPEGFWSVSSADIANAADGSSPAKTPQPSAPKAAAHKTATHGAPATASSWHAVDAGELVLPATLHPGRVEMNGRAARGAAAEPRISHIYADTHEVYLLKIPIEYRANAGFDKPLTRIDVTVTLGDTVASAQPASPGMVAPRQPKSSYARTSSDWAIKPIKDLGYNGLRHGPNPMPDGVEEYYFLGDQMLAALVADVPYLNAYWSIKASQKQIPGKTDWYAQLLVPKGASRGTITVQAKLWFSPGDEAVVVLPATLVALDVNTRGATLAKNSAPAAAPVDEPAAQDAAPSEPDTKQPTAPAAH